jgi:hypothetical protein
MSDDGNGIGRLLVGVLLVIVAAMIPVLAFNVGSRLLVDQMAQQQQAPLIRYRPLPTWANGPITIPLYTPKPRFFQPMGR